MITILIFHTECYYKEYDVTPYYIYTTNTIILFYFISGYLFFKNSVFDFKHKFNNIFRSMVVPYFFFTTLMAYPKIILHHTNTGWQEILIMIITGRASWFIISLIVAELIFTSLLLIKNNKQIWFVIISFLCFIIYFIIPFNKYNFWQWQDALLVIPFLSLGFTYHKYEKVCTALTKTPYLFILIPILIGIKIYEIHFDLPMRNIAIDNALLFLSDSLIFLLIVIILIRFIPANKYIEWTGSHCIVYYFLCGGCPFIITILLNKIGFVYNGCFYRFFIAFFLSYALITVFTKIIYKYIPFILGK